jgi:hypothetical protein
MIPDSPQIPPVPDTDLARMIAGWVRLAAKQVFVGLVDDQGRAGAADILAS